MLPVEVDFEIKIMQSLEGSFNTASVILTYSLRPLYPLRNKRASVLMMWKTFDDSCIMY